MNGQTYNEMEEGCRLACYDDKTGIILNAGDTPVGTPTISVGVTGPNVVPGLVIDQATSDQMYAAKWLIAQEDAAHCIGAAIYTSLDPVRQAAVTSQCYNLGGPHFSGFKKQIAAIQIGDWETAAAECLDSDAGRELPDRYGRLSRMYSQGNWQPGYGA